MGCGASTESLQIPQHDAKNKDKRQQNIDEKRSAYALGEYLPGFPPQCKSVPVSEEVTAKGVADSVKLFYGLIKEKVDNRFERWTNNMKKDDAAKQTPFYRFSAFFDDDELPKVSNFWKSDEEFGYQHVNGYIPQFIRRCEQMPEGFAISDAGVKPTLDSVAGGKSFEELMKAKRVYIMDHCGALEDPATGLPIQGVLVGDKDPNERCVVCIPRCLFVETDDGKVWPIAISLEKGGVVIYPQDGALWLGAKAHVLSAEYTVFFVINHTLCEHMILETIWSLLNQNLADTHPVHALIKPSTWNTVFVNVGLRGSFFQEPDSLGASGAVADVFGIGHLGTRQVAVNGFKTLEWRKFYDVPRRFEEAGVMDLKNYFFRDDTIVLFRAIDAFVGDVLKAVYGTDDELLKDAEVQAFAKDLATKSQIKDLPVSSDGRFAKIADLQLLITGILFQCGVRHSYIENTGPIYYPWVPFFPSSFRMPIPTNKDQLFTEADVSDKWMPDERRALNQVALIESKKVHIEVDMFGQYHENFLTAAPKGAKEAVAKFVENIKKAEADMKGKAEARAKAWSNPVPFTHCYPSTLASSCWN